MTLYFILGGALAVWAVIVALLGIKFDRFPGGRGGEGVIIAISALLVVATIASAIILSSLAESRPGERASQLGAPAA